MKKRTIILANASVRNGNRGCLALAYSAIYLIHTILSKSNIDYELKIPVDNTSINERSVIISGKELFFETCPYPVPFNMKSFFVNLSRIGLVLKSWKLFKRSEIVLDIGHGDSFADIYGKGRFAMVDKIHKTARFFRKPYVLLPQTIGPFSEKDIKKKAHKTLSKASFVMTRDKASFDYVKNNIPAQLNVKEYLDVAFFLPYTKRKFDDNHVHVGLNISALLWNGGYNKNNQFGLIIEYKEVIYKIISYLLGKPDVIIHLVPHVVNHVRNIENDYAVSFDLQKELASDRVVLAPLFLSPIDAKDYISGLDFFMGARMHATIAAFSSGVPVVPMAYSRKFNGLFNETLQYSAVADMKTMNSDELMSVIIKSYEQKDALKSLIQERLDGVVAERKKELMNDLSQLLLRDAK